LRDRRLHFVVFAGDRVVIVHDDVTLYACTVSRPKLLRALRGKINRLLDHRSMPHNMRQLPQKTGEAVKRNALLIGNTGGLGGIVVDIERARIFLRSLSGGQWLDSEITVLLDPRKTQVDRVIAQMRSARVDYSFFLFSGHGYHYGQTHLNLNDYDETLLESDLHSIADRQLSIFDCCRVVPTLRKAEPTMESLAATLDSVDITRTRYEERIMEAAPQHARLYSCSRGESSYDYPEGALYLSHLLGAASSIGNGAKWKTVEDAHRQARTNTIEQAEKEGNRQTPSAVLAKLPAAMQLILSIK
jgi:hypothetical protein